MKYLPCLQYIPYRTNLTVPVKRNWGIWVKETLNMYEICCYWDWYQDLGNCGLINDLMTARGEADGCGEILMSLVRLQWPKSTYYFPFYHDSAKFIKLISKCCKGNARNYSNPAGHCPIGSGDLTVSHDDVIKWKHFRVTGPLCGEFTGPGEFLAQRPVTRSFDVFFDLRPNKRLSKQPWGWWFETPSCSLWRQCNVK